MKLEKLLLNITQKDEKAFDEFYDQYARLIFTIAFSILKNDEANDVVQNVCLKLLSLPQTLLPQDNAKSWLYVLIRNEAITTYNKRKKHLHYEEIEITNNQTKAFQDHLFLEQCLQILNENEKEVILFKLNGFKFREISQFINKPTNTCIWLYHQGIKKIRREIHE